MNPKHAPALSTVPVHVIPERTHDTRVRSGDLVNVIMSIKQREQLESYIRELEGKLSSATKSTVG